MVGLRMGDGLIGQLVVLWVDGQVVDRRMEI